MTWIREWVRNLGIKLYEFGTTKDEDQLWWLQKRAGEADLFYRKYNAAVKDLEHLETILAEAQTAAPTPPKKRAPRKK